MYVSCADSADKPHRPLPPPSDVEHVGAKASATHYLALDKQKCQLQAGITKEQEVGQAAVCDAPDHARFTRSLAKQWCVGVHRPHAVYGRLTASKVILQCAHR